MDVFVHAAVGAATAHALDLPPWAGAVLAAAPDAVLGAVRGKPTAPPSIAYNATHSLLFTLTLALVLTAALGSPWGVLGALCHLSHLLLDMPTHNSRWAPPLCYPFFPARFSLSIRDQEWEFFNLAWAHGAAWATVWIVLCL